MKTRWVVIVFIGCALLGCQTRQNKIIKEIIQTQGAPAAIGPYSQGVRVGNLLFCSGQIPIDPRTNGLVTGDIATQTRRVLNNIGAVLEAAGMGYADVVQATVFLDELENYGAMNAVYAEYFGENPPARCAVEVARLPKDVGVEIAVVAVKTD